MKLNNYTPISKTNLININSLQISLLDFETIIWNHSQLDSIKNRNFLNETDTIPLQIINHLNLYMDPVFDIKRWIREDFDYDNDIKYNQILYWLNFFLKNPISVIFPKQDVVLMKKIRIKSPETYSLLIKYLNNF